MAQLGPGDSSSNALAKDRRMCPDVWVCAADDAFGSRADARRGVDGCTSFLQFVTLLRVLKRDLIGRLNSVTSNLAANCLDPLEERDVTGDR